MTTIPANQVQSKRRVGTLEGDPVWSIELKGGLAMILVMKKSGRSETLAASSHPGISLHMAQKKYPDLQITELKKSLDVPLEVFEHLLPKYDELTDALRKLQGY